MRAAARWTIASIAVALLACPAAHAGVNAFTSTGPKSGWKIIAADPLVAGRVLAVSDQTFYRSADAGAHWAKVDTTLLPESIAFDPTVRDRIYAVMAGTIQRSDDGGATFHPFSTFPVHVTVVLGFFAVADVGRMLVSPHSASDLYLTDGSLFRSGDGGKTFVAIAQSSTSFVYDLALDPAARGTVYVANQASGVAKSTDNGATWQPSADGIPQGWAGVRIAVDPTLSSRLFLVAARKTSALAIAFSFDEYAAFVSSDGGAHWQATNLDVMATLPWPQLQLVAAADGVYVRAGPRIYRSSDGGSTWQTLTLRNDDRAQALAAGANALYAAGFDYGVQRSDDHGATFASAHAGLPSPRVARVEVIEGAPFTVLAAADYNATLLTELYRRSAIDNAWHAALLAPTADWKSSSSNAVSFIDFQRQPYGFAAFAALPGTGNIIAMTNDGQVLQSSAHTVDFSLIGGGQFSFLVDKFATSASDGTTIYACGAGRLDSLGLSYISGPLARSSDGGRTWQSLVARPTGYDFGCAAIAVDPTNSDIAYIALDADVGGGFLRTVDGGSTWQMFALSTPYVRSMMVDPTESLRLLTGRGYTRSVVVVDTVTGRDQQLGEALPGMVADVAIDVFPVPPMLYAATDRGVYARPVTAERVPWLLVGASDDLSVNALRVAHSPQTPTRVTLIAATDTGVRQMTIDGPGTLRPVYRFFNRDTLAHFYTASKAERDHVVATWPQFAAEGVAFFALAQADPASTPVHRFFDPRTGVHAYAFGESERAALVAASPASVYEGIAFHVLSSFEPGAIAVYRLRNATTGGQLLTVDDDERDFVRSRLPQFAYEGAVPGVFQAGD